MDLQALKDKKVVIWGFGKEGQSVLQVIQSLYLNQNFIILSDKPVSNDVKNSLSKISNLEFKIEKDGLKNILENADIVIKSPGISLYKKEIFDAKNKGTVFTSSTNLWFAKNLTGKVIAITGTKGKSTVSSLLAYLLEKGKKSVILAGNIGIPLVDLLLKKQQFDFYVLELSSYQTSDLKYSPDIGVLLNLYPEHIGWHETHEQYYLDKLNLFGNRKKGELAILNYEDRNTQELTKNWIDVEYFNISQGFHVKDETIYDGIEEICNISEISLKGHHNLVNVCVVLTILKNLGLNPKAFIPHLKTFKALDHRLQEVWIDNKGIKYINDSISTIPESTIAAINTFKDKPITLIVGGLDRKQNHQKLAHYIISSNFVKNIITIPDTGTKIAVAIREEGAKNKNFQTSKVIESNNLEEAVAIAKKVTESNGIILLSPAAPSYNSYKDFQERGRHFEELAKSSI